MQLPETPRSKLIVPAHKGPNNHLSGKFAQRPAGKSGPVEHIVKRAAQ